MPSKPFLDVRVIGHRDAMGRFQRATNEVSRARRDEMRGLGRRVVTALQEQAPVRTGRLKRGLRFKTYESGSRLKLRVTSEAPYTEAVIRGRKGFGPVRAKALRFEPGPPGSGFIFRKWVGPAKPNPFHRRAFSSLLSGGEPNRTAGRISARIESAFMGR